MSEIGLIRILEAVCSVAEGKIRIIPVKTSPAWGSIPKWLAPRPVMMPA